MGESLANDGVEQGMEIGPEKVAMEQNKAQCEKIEIRAEVRGSSQQQ
jgi:hypothetical protein